MKEKPRPICPECLKGEVRMKEHKENYVTIDNVLYCGSGVCSWWIYLRDIQDVQ